MTTAIDATNAADATAAVTGCGGLCGVGAAVAGCKSNSPDIPHRIEAETA